jgi:hypothetical protein
MENLKQPTINVEEIQEAANKAAKKAYLSEIENYYTSYNSPYKKMISEELKKQKFGYPIEMPDILNQLNEAIISEVDQIANEAIALSFIPMLTEAFVRIDKNIKMSDVLKMIIEEINPDSEDYESFAFGYEKDSNHGWLNCHLATPVNYYEFTLHTVSESEKTDKVKYQLLSFPHNTYKSGYNNNMIIHKDDVKIEMPFSPGVLKDKVLFVFFKTMLSKCKIDVDCSDFDEDMFPERECYC